VTGFIDAREASLSPRSLQDASTRPMAHVTDDSQKSHPWHQSSGASKRAPVL